MGVYRTTRRVEFRDTDSAGIMHFSTYFTKMEEVEHEFLRSLGMSVHMTAEDGATVSWPRVAAQCEYRGSARFEEQLDIELGIENLGRSSVRYAFTFRHDGQELAVGKVTTVYCRFGEPGRPQSLPIPDSVRDKFAPYLLTA